MYEVSSEIYKETDFQSKKCENGRKCYIQFEELFKVHLHLEFLYFFCNSLFWLQGRKHLLRFQFLFVLLVCVIYSWRTVEHSDFCS